MILLGKTKSWSWGFKKGLIQAISRFNFPNKAPTKMESMQNENYNNKLIKK